MRPTSPGQVRKAEEMLLAGVAAPDVAREVRVSVATIYRINRSLGRARFPYRVIDAVREVLGLGPLSEAS